MELVKRKIEFNLDDDGNIDTFTLFTEVKGLTNDPFKFEGESEDTVYYIESDFEFDTGDCFFDAISLIDGNQIRREAFANILEGPEFDAFERWKEYYSARVLNLSDEHTQDEMEELLNKKEIGRWIPALELSLTEKIQAKLKESLKFYKAIMDEKSPEIIPPDYQDASIRLA